MQIVNRVLEGDTERFSFLMDRYSGRVFALVVRIVDCQEDAEEITQDVFLKAFRSLGRFDGRSSFSTWLFRIAYNEAVSHTRRAQRPEALVDDSQLQAVSDRSVDAWFESDDPRMAALPQAIDCLGVEERTLLTLHYFEGIPLKEVAVMMDMGESAAKVRLMRTRKKLYVLINKLAARYE